LKHWHSESKVESARNRTILHFPGPVKGCSYYLGKIHSEFSSLEVSYLLYYSLHATFVISFHRRVQPESVGHWVNLLALSYLWNLVRSCIGKIIDQDDRITAMAHGIPVIKLAAITSANPQSNMPVTRAFSYQLMPLQYLSSVLVGLCKRAFVSPLVYLQRLQNYDSSSTS
jgi:hypothetical protein